MNGIRQNEKVMITSFSRVHLTLIGMNNDGYRINGGIGFSISTPIIHSYFEEFEGAEIIDEREMKFTDQEKFRLKHTLNESINRFNLKKGIKCTIRGDILPHCGLGSNTAIYMSCIEGLFLLNGRSYKHNDIVALSKRGGTSGIGINTYFHGGFVFDVGIKNKNEQLFNPSSVANRNGEKPLVIHKCKLPDWEIGICIPKYISSKSEQEEVDFFKNNCPIDKILVKNVLYEAVYGITSSIIENDYEVFCKSVDAIQSTQWKYMERSLYGKDLMELEQKIKNLGADSVGMSSLGPTLFFTGKNISEIILKISHTVPEITCYMSSLNNQGRIIKYD
jgi:beta-ribofuranosylaminobenzene 5'-phosphate synthase